MATIPYVPTYLRATPPTIWPAVSPLDFGAIGNGSTDDHPAITAALQTLAAKGGGTLVFPNDRDFRIATPGVHGIHLQQQSNITIMMGERSRLIMDNMVDGLAVSHGIFVEGPCENISLIGVHVKYASLAVSRQVWAPIYFLGANLGTGDEGAGGWYRGEPGGERPDLIAAGAIRNVRLENVTSEDSPSVGIALIGVDGVTASNITVRETWADGIYCRSHRRVQLDGYYGWHVGDDGLSMGSEESSYELADIEHDFHGEGSVFSNLVLEGRPSDNPPPSGSVVLLGVKDTAISNVVCIDRYRAIRIESGTHHTLGYPNLNINFLADRRVTIDNVSIDRCVQDISILPLECNAATPDKWWRHDILISNVVGENGGSAIDCYGPGIPLNGGSPLPIWGGITFRNMKFLNYANVSQTFIGMVDCVFDGFETDSTVSIQGFVPYSIDPDILDGGGHPMFVENRSVFRDFKGSTILIQGLKRCWFDNLQSTSALRDAITFLNCADIVIGSVRVRYPNRINDPIANSALAIDEFCKRVSVGTVEVEQDDNIVHSLGFRAAGKHRAELVRVKTSQAPPIPYVTMVSDRSWIDDKVSQIARAEWMHDGSGDWGGRDFPSRPLPAVQGDTDVQVFIEGQASTHRIVTPLASDHRWTFYDARAAIGDRIEVVREETSSGNVSVTFEGQAPVISPPPQSDAYTSFSVTGGAGGLLTSILVNGTTELLTADVPWLVSDEETTIAVAASINAGSHGFVATATQKLIFLRAPELSRLEYNNARLTQVTTGNLLLSYGVIPRMIGGNDATSAGEVTAYSSFLIVGDTETYHGTIASITVDDGDAVHELLAAPVTWGPDSNRTAYLVAEAAMENYAAHGFTVSSSRNCVLIKAPPGHGASANGWPVTVTPTGDVTLYDVKAMTGGIDPDIPTGDTADTATTTSVTIDDVHLRLRAPIVSPGLHEYTFSVYLKGGTMPLDGWSLRLYDGAGNDIVGSGGIDGLSITPEWALYTISTFEPVDGGVPDDLVVSVQRAGGHSPGPVGSTVFVSAPKLTIKGDDTNLLTTADWKDATYGETSGFDLEADVIAPIPPYTIATTYPGAPFHAIFQFTATGWTLVSLNYDQPRYPNGRPMYDPANRLLSANGDPIVDEFKNVKYASGAVLGWDSGMLAMGLSAPPSTSSSFGNAGMTTYDASYLYVCIASNTWKRVALSSF